MHKKEQKLQPKLNKQLSSMQVNRCTNGKIIGKQTVKNFITFFLNDLVTVKYTERPLNSEIQYI